MKEFLETLAAFLVAVLPAAGALIGAIYLGRNKSAETSLVALRGDMKERDQRIDELEYDRDRGWDLARHWHSEAYKTYLLLVRARFNANHLADRLEVDHPCPDDTPEPVGLEDPIPRKDPQ